MTAIDTLLSASVKAVQESGATQTSLPTGIVSEVASDGTLTVLRGEDEFPRVRLLTSYGAPVVGDHVQIMQGSGGWVCLGALVNYNPNWVAPTLNSPITNHSGFQGAQYQRRGRVVEIQGLVNRNSSTGDVVVFTLPATHRPPSSLVFPTTGTTNIPGQIRVRFNGEVVLQGIPAVDYISINCTFGL